MTATVHGLSVRREEASTDYDHVIWWDVIYEPDGKPVHPFAAGFTTRRAAQSALSLLRATGADWSASREEISASAEMPLITEALNLILDTRPDRPGGHAGTIPDATSLTLAHFRAEHSRAYRWRDAQAKEAGQ